MKQLTQYPIRIRPDASVKFADVVEVMDACARIGFNGIGFARLPARWGLSSCVPQAYRARPDPPPTACWLTQKKHDLADRLRRSGNALCLPSYSGANHAAPAKPGPFRASSGSKTSP